MDSSSMLTVGIITTVHIPSRHRPVSPALYHQAGPGNEWLTECEVAAWPYSPDEKALRLGQEFIRDAHAGVGQQPDPEKADRLEPPPPQEGKECLPVGRLGWRQPPAGPRDADVENLVATRMKVGIEAAMCCGPSHAGSINDQEMLTNIAVSLTTSVFALPNARHQPRRAPERRGPSPVARRRSPSAAWRGWTASH